MICDDDSDILTTYKSVLSNSYNVIATSSGQECLSKYSEELKRGTKIDALLLDYRLGDMSGDEVAYRIKEIGSNVTKVILITAYELEKKFLAKLKDGKCIITDIKKPISSMALLEKVTQVLNPEQNKTFDNASKEVVVEAIIAAMDRRLGPDTTRLVQKTLKLVYKIDEDKIREQPELFEEKLEKLLGDRTVKIITNDASKALRK
jgi:response regulator RpfG family c-di-GMP phosphodiesterase